MEIFKSCQLEKISPRRKTRKTFARGEDHQMHEDFLASLEHKSKPKCLEIPDS
jgi:hypothetical protein